MFAQPGPEPASMQAPEPAPWGCIDTGCNKGQGSPAERWSYVGEGRGQYEKIDQYNFVGEGSGDFSKVLTTNHYGFRLKKMWLCLICVAAVVFGCSWLSSRASGDGDSDNTDVQKSGRRKATASAAVGPVAPESGRVAGVDASRTDGALEPRFNCNLGNEAEWDDGKKGWCCWHFGLGCVVPTKTGVKYDCTQGAAMWESKWSLGKRDWCCQHEPLHCPPDLRKGTPAARAQQRASPPTTAAPAPPQPQPAAAQPQGSPAGAAASPSMRGTAQVHQGCDAICVFKGAAASCRDRIHWSERHSYQAQGADACRLSHQAVMGQCSVCAGCTAEDVGCPVAPATPAAAAAVPPQAAPPAAVVPAAPAAPAAVPVQQVAATQAANPHYSCNDWVTNGLNWDPDKRTWCCLQEGLGCSEAAAFLMQHAA